MLFDRKLLRQLSIIEELKNYIYDAVEGVKKLPKELDRTLGRL